MKYFAPFLENLSYEAAKKRENGKNMLTSVITFFHTGLPLTAALPK